MAMHEPPRAGDASPTTQKQQPGPSTVNIIRATSGSSASTSARSSPQSSPSRGRGSSRHPLLRPTPALGLALTALVALALFSSNAVLPQHLPLGLQGGPGSSSSSSSSDTDSLPHQRQGGGSLGRRGGSGSGAEPVASQKEGQQQDRRDSFELEEGSELLSDWMDGQQPLFGSVRHRRPGRGSRPDIHELAGVEPLFGTD